VSRRAPLAAINITPLVDVLLILVAVLLLLAPHFVKPLPVDLPRTSLNGTPVTQHSLQVALQKDGTLILEGHVSGIEELRARIQPGVTTLEVAADAATPYARIVHVVEALRDVNPREVVLLTQ
jgi:biopolymer transport protein ExbD